MDKYVLMLKDDIQSRFDIESEAVQSYFKGITRLKVNNWIIISRDLRIKERFNISVSDDWGVIDSLQTSEFDKIGTYLEKWIQTIKDNVTHEGILQLAPID